MWNSSRIAQQTPLIRFPTISTISGRESRVVKPSSPSFSSWPHYLEAYHNHFHRFRNKNVTFMEAGVQFGGKIWVLRDYFGPGLTYIGVDSSPTTKLLETADWIHIEIGDMANRDFLRSVKENYPHGLWTSFSTMGDTK